MYIIQASKYQRDYYRQDLSRLCSDTTKHNVCLMFCSIFILLSRESDGCAIFWNYLHSFRRCRFPSFQVDFFLFLVNLLLVQNHQAEIIIVMRLIHEHNKVT